MQILATRKTVIIALAAFAIKLVVFAGVASAAERPASFADLADKLLPAVVNISSTQKAADASEAGPELPEFPEGSPLQEFFEEYTNRRGDMFPSMPQASLGSGFVINAERGLIVTNNHVVRDADEIRVTFHDDTSVVAKLLGTDEKTDLAVLEIKPRAKTASVTFGDSDKMRVGDWILAIGNPFGLGGTVTSGIISARQRDISAGPYDDFIQTDASINRGNSGGPMFNLNGDVIGINTAIFSPSGGSVGIGFAIPSNLAKPVIEQIVKYGRTRRGWIGVRIQAVTEEIAESLGLPKVEGALVASITPKGPAEQAGLKPGDIITQFNGLSINAMRQLPRIVADAEIGAKAKLTFWRAGKIGTTEIEIAELEKAEDEGLLGGTPKKTEAPKATGSSLTDLDIKVGALTEAERSKLGIPASTKGLLVTHVGELSEAAEKGIQAGDVILEINQQKLSNPDQAKDLVAEAAKDGKTTILMLIDMQGRGDVRFVALKLKKN